MNDSIKITGKVLFRLLDINKKLIKEFRNHNTITTAGKELLVDWLTTYPHNNYFMKYIALGTGTPSISALGSEIGSRVEIINSNPGYSNIWQSYAFFEAGNATGTLTEVGLFNQSVVGTMFSSSIINIAKDINSSLEVIWQITFN